MTKAYAELGDNGGRCEGCNKPETIHTGQVAMPLYMGGGLGWGTIWLCPECVKERQEREAKKEQPA